NLRTTKWVSFAFWCSPTSTVQLNLQKKPPQLHFLSHYVNDQNSTAFPPVEDATRPYVNLAVNRLWQFGWHMAGIGESFKAINTGEYLLHETGGGARLV